MSHIRIPIIANRSSVSTTFFRASDVPGESSQRDSLSSVLRVWSNMGPHRPISNIRFRPKPAKCSSVSCSVTSLPGRRRRETKKVAHALAFYHFRDKDAPRPRTFYYFVPWADIKKTRIRTPLAQSTSIMGLTLEDCTLARRSKSARCGGFVLLASRDLFRRKGSYFLAPRGCFGERVRTFGLQDLF